MNAKKLKIFRKYWKQKEKKKMKDNKVNVVKKTTEKESMNIMTKDLGLIAKMPLQFCHFF